MIEERIILREETLAQRLERRRLEKQARSARRKLAISNDKATLDMLRARNEQLEKEYAKFLNNQEKE